ncbi:MAG: hypothetical protein FWF72_01430 [Paludibacter sp.]|nr:hypothetical protein [Paludibacter sp.]
MGKSRKYITFILLGIICSFVSCNKSTPFDKDKWVKCGGFDGRYFIADDGFVKGNTRYKMALWLEKNYNFYDKSLNEILEKFYIIPEHFERYDSLAFEQVKNDKKIRIVTKQRNPNFIIGINTWIDIDWIEIYFDENYMALNVCYVHYNHKTNHKTERKI